MSISYKQFWKFKCRIELFSKPSLQGLKRALEKDPDFIAKSLLNCHYQSIYLDKVLHAAEHYINSDSALMRSRRKRTYSFDSDD